MVFPYKEGERRPESKSLQLTGLSKDIFDSRYAYPGEKEWINRSRVMSKTASQNETDPEAWEQHFYDVIRTGDFMPGGRIIYGCGRKDQNLLNCFVLIPDDTVESIAKLLQDTYRISCGGGGVGFNFSKIRPKGDRISNIPFSAPGSVSVMKMINSIGDQVKAGKNRRTAIMGILNVDHPDVMEFLHVKLDEKQLNNFNISVGITNRFIDAVTNEEDWIFEFNGKRFKRFKLLRQSPNELDENITIFAYDAEDAIGRALNHRKKTSEDGFLVILSEEDDNSHPMKAREIWELIFVNAMESGDPGIYNIDFANSYTNVGYFSRLDSTNPCGEVPLEDKGNCCLGHINLNNMIDDEGVIDWKRLAKAVRIGIRFLDNILDVNHYPIEECISVAHRSRRIGLGVTGLHYMLIKAGLRYGSEKSLEFLDRLFATIRDEAYKASAYIAREKGSFPAYNWKDYLFQDFAKTLPPRIRHIIKTLGIRNAVMLTSAPCGTNSIVLGVSTGIEPIFSPMYLRRYRDANVWKEQVVVDSLFKKYVKEKKELWNFVGAYDVTPEEHIRVQATIQRYIDQSISKTCNLPENTKPEEFFELVLQYAPYVKGYTIYRAGSKGNEPLENIPLTEENVAKYVTALIEKENGEEMNSNEYNVVEGVSDATVCTTVEGNCG